jgi:hypothetical protein
MAEFTMCKPQVCKIKNTCQRYISKASEKQIYFKKEPCNQDGSECEMFFKKNCKPCGEI